MQHGNDMQHIKQIPNRRECAKKCHEHAECVGFEYYPAGNRDCYLTKKSWEDVAPANTGSRWSCEKKGGDYLSLLLWPTSPATRKTEQALLSIIGRMINKQFSSIFYFFSLRVPLLLSREQEPSRSCHSAYKRIFTWAVCQTMLHEKWMCRLWLGKWYK